MEELGLIDLEKDLLNYAALVTAAEKLGKLFNLPDLFCLQFLVQQVLAPLVWLEVRWIVLWRRSQVLWPRCAVIPLL